MNDLSSIGPLERGTDDGAPGPRLSRRALLKNGAVACLAGAAGACVPVERDSSQSEGEIELSALSQCEKMLDLDYTADERAQILATIDNQLDAIRADPVPTLVDRVGRDCRCGPKTSIRGRLWRSPGGYARSER